jgi:hypothetical protein
MPDHLYLRLTIESEMTIERCAVHQARVLLPYSERTRDEVTNLAERVFRGSDYLGSEPDPIPHGLQN